jgi:hypothetical protein
MKNAIPAFICLLFFALCGSAARAQQSDNSFDTLGIQRIGRVPGKYLVKGTGITMIDIQSSGDKVVANMPRSIALGMLQNVILSLAGSGTVDAKGVTWLRSAALLTNEPRYDWRIDVYCPGRITEQTIRVRNDDGSASTEYETRESYDWGKGSVGFIFESGDTIGRYIIFMEPRHDSLLNRWSGHVYKGKAEPDKIIVNPKVEFALKGEFHGKESVIIFNLDEKRIYLFDRSDLKCIYQPDFLQGLVKKSKRVPQLLLVNKTLTGNERMDYLRLATVAQYFYNSINPK